MNLFDPAMFGTHKRWKTFWARQALRQRIRDQLTATPRGRGNQAVRRINEMRAREGFASLYSRQPIIAFNTPGDQFLSRAWRGSRRGIAVI